MKRLNEDNINTPQETSDNTLYVYEDEETGIKYIYDGTQLVPLNKPLDDPEPFTPLDELDEEELARQDEERQKQIEKEIEEYGDAVDQYGADSKQAGAWLQDISDLVYDSETAQALLDETERIVRADALTRQKERKAAEAEAKRYIASDGINDFEFDLANLIRTEVKAERHYDYGKLNKKYSRTQFIKPGVTQKKKPNIPRLFVYFDQSISWHADDIEVGMQAISKLDTFVKQKKLVIEVYYFADRVGTSPNRSELGSSTRAGKLLIDHIAKNNPTNVVIMTDSDFDSPIFPEILQAGKVTVPGGAFLLFRRGKVSHRLVDRVHGEIITKIYSF